MKTLILAAACCVVLFGCGGSDGSAPIVAPISSESAPVISGLSVSPTTSRVNSGYGWCNTCFWPEYGCTNTTDLVFSFYCKDADGDLQNLTISWVDSRGKFTSSRVNPNGVLYSPNKTISYTIPAAYQEPAIIGGTDSGAGQGNCSAETRTYTYTIHMTDRSGNKSNKLTAAWTVY